MRRLNRLSESNGMVGDIDFWKNTDDRVYEKCLNTMSIIVAEDEWWETTYNDFKHQMEDKFGADVDLKNTHFRLGHNRYFETDMSIDIDGIAQILKEERAKPHIVKLIELGAVDGGFDSSSHNPIEIFPVDVEPRYYKELEKILKKSKYYKSAMSLIKGDDIENYEGKIEHITEWVVGGERDDLQDVIDDWYVDITEDVLYNLERELEYLQSEENLVEFARNNEYEFDENGKIA